MRKNRLFVLGIITMFVAILSLTLVSGTMARYRSDISGSDTAYVAKWLVRVNEVDATQTASFDFDLFNTINDSDGSAENDVKEHLIAPGTKGSFKIILKNESQVNATFGINFTSALLIDDVESTDYLPINFKVKANDTYIGGTYKSLESFNSLIQNQDIPMESGTVTYTIEWEWPIDFDDTEDTKLGIEAQGGNVKYMTSVQVVFAQVD